MAVGALWASGPARNGPWPSTMTALNRMDSRVNTKLARCRPMMLMLLCVVSYTAAASAEDHQIRWWTIDGGGGRSMSAGDLRVEGTLGQPEPEAVPLCTADGGAACVGARYSLRGGFWPGLSVSWRGNGCASENDCLLRDGFESPSSPASAPAHITHR